MFSVVGFSSVLLSIFLFEPRGSLVGLSMFLFLVSRAEAVEASIWYHCWTIVIYDVLFVRLCGDVGRLSNVCLPGEINVEN